MSTRSRLAALAALVLIAAAAFFALRPGDDDDASPAATTPSAAATTPNATTGTPPATTTTTTTPTTPTPAPPLRIRVRGGEPVGGLAELDVKEGDQIRFSVTADAPASVHLHGYDVEQPVGPGQPARFSVPATISGVFEIELEGSGVQLAKLTVEP